MSNISFKRQLAIFDPSDFADRIVTIIGVGNIGSHAAINIARLGIHIIFVFDPDKVEPHNVASQSYNLSDIGQKKVHCIRNKILDINRESMVFAVDKKFKPSGYNSNLDIVVIAVDSMKARKEIAKMYKNDLFPRLLIDARIGGNQIEIYNCRSLKEWNDTFTDNPSTDPCGGRYISYVSAMVGGMIASQIKNGLTTGVVDKSIMVDASTMDVVKNFSWK